MDSVQVFGRLTQVLLSQPLHGQSPVVRRRHALELLKTPIEVGNIVEARFETHIGYRFVTVGQQLTGFADAQSIDEFDEAAAGGLLLSLIHISEPTRPY